MPAKKSELPWQDKVCNNAQIGGIETSVLDDGLARGNRIAWINTGSGLRYKVVIDRCLDISEAFFNQHSLAFLTHSGFTAPRPDANRGLEWLRSFGGGLLTTCGLTHIGGPESDDSEERGLHGRVSNIPAQIESIIQPDPAAGKLDMSITAVIKQTSMFGPNLEMRRTISGRLGEAAITITDCVTNRGNTTAPHMILYHCNFGWPLVDEGTDIVWDGRYTNFGSEQGKDIFNEKGDYKKCKKPLESHRGFGEACASIDVTPDKKGFCTVGLVNSKLNLALMMSYKKKQLPCLTNWQHWGFGEYVTALEPGTNPPTGQNLAREQNKLIELEPGESRSYKVKLSVLTDSCEIKKLIC
ncbi:aldose 1-epimerase family protein [Planctomycetota bacterium]